MIPTRRLPVRWWSGQIPRLDKRLWVSALVVTLAIFGLSHLNETTIYRGGKTGRELERLEKDRKEAREELDQNIRENDKLGEELQSYLKRYNSPLPKEFVASAIKVERASGIKNFATFSVAVSGTESTFGKHYPRGSYNVWGIGGSNLASFSSWLDGQVALAKLLNRFYGQKVITIDDLPSINRWYASSKVWWRSVSSFWEEI